MKVTEHKLRGNKLFQERAREALPLLVRQAKAEQPVCYSDLAEELSMSNPRNLNHVLGYIGEALKELVRRLWGHPLKGTCQEKKVILP